MLSLFVEMYKDVTLHHTFCQLYCS